MTASAINSRPHSRRAPPFSLRLSPSEKAHLREAARGLPMAAYIKSLLFSEHAPRPPLSRRRASVHDTKLLAEVLACLGSSRIANNLNQLAKHANQGNLYFDRDTQAQLNAACADVRAMRQLLMQALGMKLGEEPPARQSTSQSFARASAPR